MSTFLKSKTRASCLLVFFFSVVWNSFDGVVAFSVVGPSSPTLVTPSKFSKPDMFSLSVAMNSDDLMNEMSAVLPDDKVKPLIRLNKESSKEKVVNAFGLWTMFVSLVTCPVWLLAMKVVDTVNKMNKEIDPNRAIYDGTGKIWSKLWLSLSMCYPKITGEVDQISKDRGACLYVANHASWLDIPIVCTVLHPVFKFISKGELKNLPCIGDQLRGGNHVLIDREDRRSQLRTFKEAIAWLNKGVPLMAFPEGQRSADGRLLNFKGGTFSMAMKTNVPIIPITISNAHAVMPANALFPVQHGRNKLNVHVHPAIEVEGRTDSEIAELVRTAIISKLPMDQRPLPENTDAVNSVEDAKE